MIWGVEGLSPKSQRMTIPIVIMTPGGGRECRALIDSGLSTPLSTNVFVEGRPQEPPKPILMEGEREWLVDSIVDKCVYGRKHITQYQVQWKEHGFHKDTWELLKHLRNAKDHVMVYEN